MASQSKLETLNAADDRQAVAMVQPLIERAPTLAARIAAARPFASADTLATCIAEVVSALDEPAAIALFRGHPELAPMDPAAMTAESQSEQARLGLHLAAAPADLAEMNARYAERFGFPFILALHEHYDLASVLETFRHRLTASRAEEIAANKAQICSVARARALAAFGPETALAS